MIKKIFGLIVSLLLFVMIFTAIDGSFIKLTENDQTNSISVEEIAGSPTLRGGIFSDYIFPFELLSILLLAALIGALYMAKKEVN